MQRYRKIKTMGRKKFASSVLVKSEMGMKFFAREIDTSGMEKSEIEALMNEVNYMRDMRCSNIVNYADIFVERSCLLFIVMDYADGGDLNSSICWHRENKFMFTETEIMRVFVQICLGLRHIHSHNIIHRNIKSQNIFFTTNGVVKLGDFCVAKILDPKLEYARTQIENVFYMSPEIYRNQPYGKMSDVWSLGIVLYQTFALNVPFQVNNMPALANKITYDSFPNIPQHYCKKSTELLKTLLEEDPEARPTVNQILNNSYVRSQINTLLLHAINTSNTCTVPYSFHSPENSIGRNDNIDATQMLSIPESNLQESSDEIQKNLNLSIHSSVIGKGWVQDVILENYNQKICEARLNKMRVEADIGQAASPLRIAALKNEVKVLSPVVTKTHMRMCSPYDDFIARIKSPAAVKLKFEQDLWKNRRHCLDENFKMENSTNSPNEQIRHKTVNEGKILDWYKMVADERKELQIRLLQRQQKNVERQDLSTNSALNYEVASYENEIEIQDPPSNYTTGLYAAELEEARRCAFQEKCSILDESKSTAATEIGRSNSSSESRYTDPESCTLNISMNRGRYRRGRKSQEEIQTRNNIPYKYLDRSVSLDTSVPSTVESQMFTNAVVNKDLVEMLQDLAGIIAKQ